MAVTEPVLPGFTEASFTHDGTSRRIFRAGRGPPVVVIHEAPGITPPVATSPGIPPAPRSTRCSTSYRNACAQGDHTRS
jgi:hypothetical protein